jgi:cellulase/cellobiase CelA1
VAAGAAKLSASYARAANTGLLGLTGYRGEITVTNGGTGAASTWEVTLSLPGGQKVNAASGADYSQDGDRVTFTPTGATASVKPEQTVAFTFDVTGLLAGEPTGCAVNGQPCR